MNIGYYGHTNTIVYTKTNNDKFYRIVIPAGARMMYESVSAAAESGDSTSLQLKMNLEENAGDYTYRRDYYELTRYEAPDKTLYDGVSKYLGYENGESADNIFSVLPDDGALSDILLVWDEGYGGLAPPDCVKVLWASDKALPDREQFDKIADKCFLFLDGNVLRNAGAMISSQISWERTVTELIAEIQSNPAISYLLNAQQLLISFDLDGAVLILPKSKSGALEASLILTHSEAEGAANKKQQGQDSNVIVFQLMATTLALGFSMDLTYIPQESETSDISFDTVFDKLIFLFNHLDMRATTSLENAENEAVRRGGVIRIAFEIGEHAASVLPLLYEYELNHTDEQEPKTYKPNMKDWPAFHIPVTRDNDLYKVPDNWTVIDSVGRQILDVASEYVINGPDAIEGLPRFSIGSLTTIDRWEIEAFQNIRNLILDYAYDSIVKPLSIAVFGSPGSGKSFGITQVATNILPGKTEKLEFNVSQFLGAHSLSTAFQRVRDVILEGKLPLVFFDEFDSDRDGRKLGWIKSFLMAMQDGRFSDESGDHPLGKCILVFAGGTNARFEDFSAPLNHSEGTVLQDFYNVKGPDFISRLKGTIDVLGPNPINSDDQNYVLRRSLLLRNICLRDSRLTIKDGIAPINPRIVQAMLRTKIFRHGTRSMEAILAMSRIKGGTWEPAALPSNSQLALHVDANDFLSITRSY